MQVTIVYGPAEKEFNFVEGETIADALQDKQVIRALGLPASLKEVRIVNRAGETLSQTSSLTDGSVYTVEKAGNDKGVVSSTSVKIVYGPSEFSYLFVEGETIADALADKQAVRTLGLPSSLKEIRVLNAAGETVSTASSLSAGAIYTVEKAGNDKGDI